MSIQLTKLESTNRDDRLAVIDEIRKQRSIDSLDALTDHLEREEERAIREKIALVLDELLPDAGSETIGRMIRSEDSFTRNCAIETMRKADDKVIPILGELSSDPDHDVRKFAIDALQDRDTPEVRYILRKRLNDDDPNVVYTAVDYLGNLQDDDAGEAIELLAMNSEDNPMLFCTCMESLAKIGRAACSPELVAHCRTIGDNPLLSNSILKYMGSCAAFEAVESYVLTLSHKTGELMAEEIINTVVTVCAREKNIELSAQLKKVLRELTASADTGENRYELAKLLADTVNVKESLAAARSDLGSNDPLMVLAAIEIIGKYGEEEDIDALEKIAEESASDEILELIGDAVEEIMKRTDLRSELN